MITRRSFFGAVAALAVSPVAAKAVPVAVPKRRTHGLKGCMLSYDGRAVVWDGPIEPTTWLIRVPRRDDGDTILELR